MYFLECNITCFICSKDNWIFHYLFVVRPKCFIVQLICSTNHLILFWRYCSTHTVWDGEFHPCSNQSISQPPTETIQPGNMVVTFIWQWLLIKCTRNFFIVDTNLHVNNNSNPDLAIVNWYIKLAFIYSFIIRMKCTLYIKEC